MSYVFLHLSQTLEVVLFKIYSDMEFEQEKVMIFTYLVKIKCKMIMTCVDLLYWYLFLFPIKLFTVNHYFVFFLPIEDI